MMDKKHELLVGISKFAPFVIADKEHFSGFEIALWEKVAKEANISYTYTLMPFQDLLSALREKKIDIAMAGLTLTEERETYIDFTHGTFDSGLLILVPCNSKLNILKTLGSVFHKDVRNIFLTLIIAVIIASNLVWFAEQGGGGTLDGPYLPGVFNAMWWSFVTFATIGYGDYTPVTLFGRIVGVVVILFGLAFFGLYIGQLSSSLTLRKLNSDISSPEDLEAKKVATVIGSISVDCLNKLNAIVVAVKTIDDAYSLIEAGNVAAVVFDAPVLLDHLNNDKSGKFTIAGGLFEKQEYGFALPEGSELRETINRVILKLRDSGEYQRLYQTWFGKKV